MKLVSEKLNLFRSVYLELSTYPVGIIYVLTKLAILASGQNVTFNENRTGNLKSSPLWVNLVLFVKEFNNEALLILVKSIQV